MDTNELASTVKQANQKFTAVKEEIGKVIVGQTDMVDRLLLALLADGHILLEGLPGLAKTLAATTLAKVVQCEYKRIQFTPDLLPADLIGTQIYNQQSSSFDIKKGPIFTNVLIADEINRAPAKVQSALLEVMQERQVTFAGQTFAVGQPYFVLATQNPIEHEGTYPLPEAQTDRFMMKVKIGYPSKLDEEAILQRMGTLGKKPEPEAILSREDILSARPIVNQIYVDPKIKEYILNIIFSTREPESFGIKDLDGLLLFGASPRATLAMKIGAQAHAFLMGRAYVNPYDIKQIAHDILRHRLRRTYEAEAQGLSSDDILDRILNHLPIP